jgi:hypothetical protein
MEDKKPRSSRKQAPAQIGESDDFVLPVAPPAAPPPSRTTSATASKSGRSSKLFPQESNPPPLPLLKETTRKKTLPVHSDTQKETNNDFGDSSDASVSINREKAASSSLVAGLVFAVVVLLLIVIIKFNHSPEHVATPIASSSEYEAELRTARAETEASRREIAGMEGKIRDLEEQLVASPSKTEEQVAGLLEENKRLKSQNGEISVENSRLTERLQTATRLATASGSSPPVQNSPVIQEDGQSYRVTGLRPGDTLNVRSGPGVSNPVVTALQNGANVTVTGAAVMNGPDEWLPCILTLNGVDPVTGYNRSWNQKCWINSFFIEPIEN